MDQLASFLDAVIKPRYQEDFVDRLNYRYTGWLLLAFAITLSAKQYVGKPIQCWVPAEFRGGWEQYVEDYCFIENTYYLPFDSHVPQDLPERQHREINYYQWVPFVLALMALMFNLPHMIWRMLNWLSGLHIQAIISMASDSKNIAGDDHDKVVKMISHHIDDSIRMGSSYGSVNSNPISWILSCGKSSGIYVVILYFLTKLLFIANLIGQFAILNSFLGPDYTFWGASILSDLINGRDWTESGHFPRVTMCDFEIRKLGGLPNMHRYTVQCVLMINMFNEKIFLYLWWWFLLVLIATVVSAIHWIFANFIPSNRNSFILTLLQAQDDLPEIDNRNKTNDFVAKLRPDAIFVLRLMSKNVGDVITAHIVKKLWRSYLGLPDDEEQDTPGKTTATAPNNAFNSQNVMNEEHIPLIDQGSPDEKGPAPPYKRNFTEPIATRS